ncbi:MAG: hypothetical protein WC797_02945 [Candidatus Paceibacterota bacterium]|jgi:vacuolar-type H+-ATPase subunit H
MNKTDKKVISTVKNAVVVTAAKAELLEQKAKKAAGMMKQKWDSTKSKREKAKQKTKAVLEKAEQRAGGILKKTIQFGKDVAEGVREGVDEVKKK